MTKDVTVLAESAVPAEGDDPAQRPRSDGAAAEGAAATAAH